MLSQNQKNGEINIKEHCGIGHEPQVVEIEYRQDTPPIFFLRDSIGGALIPAQRSAVSPEKIFLLLEIKPFQELRLAFSDAGSVPHPPGGVRILKSEGGVTLRNGLIALELESDTTAVMGGNPIPGPVRRFKKEGGAWRGKTFLDSVERPENFLFETIEEGPIRSACRFRIGFKGGHFYEILITLDAGQTFARFDEKFDCGRTDQIVWDFHGECLPEHLRLLDSTEGFTPLSIHYHIDHRMARLFAWTQFSQLFDLSDGFGILFPDGDEAGFVALDGGGWKGGQLNHLELWARRWIPGDHLSRSGLPPEAKADSIPSPEIIPPRDSEVCEPHLNLEGWLGKGRRIFALACTDKSSWGFNPADELEKTSDPFKRKLSPGLGHFEHKIQDAGKLKQYHLRKIHIRRGMMPLQALLGMSFEWPEEENPPVKFGWPHPSLTEHHGCSRTKNERDDAESMMDYLKARVHGFWSGSGAAFTNCVSGRRIAPEMFHFEHLSSENSTALSPGEKKLCRSLFAFLSYLNFSDNYYPGSAAMAAPGSTESFEPTIAGMSNQNFYTDVCNVFGTAAQIFNRHPKAPAWREKFGAMLNRQLEYHMYPESGTWEESHTYYQHVLVTLFPLLSRRRADGVDDFFSNPAFQKLASFVLKLATPRDKFFGGLRHLTVFGDHAADVLTYREMYLHYSDAFKDSAPDLSSNLSWLHVEMGGTPGGSGALVPSAPEWKSEYIQGLGFFFRGRDNGGDEELLALRCGASWGHHHADDGSVQFYAKGRAWITDAAFGNPAAKPEEKFSADGHSRWTPGGMNPLNYLWRFNRGWISARGNGDFEWATAYSPVFMRKTENDFIPLAGAIMHYRTIVRLMPCAYLVLDSIELPGRNMIRYHVPASASAISCGGGMAKAELDGHALEIASLPPGNVSISRSEPADPKIKDKFATTGILFDCGPGCLAATVFALRKNEDPPLSVDRKNGSVHIGALSRSWDIVFKDQFNLEISERSTSGRNVKITAINERKAYAPAQL